MYYRVEHNLHSYKEVEADNAREAVEKSGYSKMEITNIHSSKTTGVGSVWLPVSTQEFKGAVSYRY